MTRGMRNNNPANIRRSASKWVGLRQIQSDKAFCQFTEMRYGIRAFFKLMRTYRYKYNCKTPRQILTRFAPASENDLPKYLDFIKSKGFLLDNEIFSNECYAVFGKYIFLYESKFPISTVYLIDVMKEMDCMVINSKKERHELTLF